MKTTPNQIDEINKQRRDTAGLLVEKSTTCSFLDEGENERKMTYIGNFEGHSLWIEGGTGVLFEDVEKDWYEDESAFIGSLPEYQRERACKWLEIAQTTSPATGNDKERALWLTAGPQRLQELAVEIGVVSAACEAADGNCGTDAYDYVCAYPLPQERETEAERSARLAAAAADAADAKKKEEDEKTFIARCLAACAAGASRRVTHQEDTGYSYYEVTDYVYAIENGVEFGKWTRDYGWERLKRL